MSEICTTGFSTFICGGMKVRKPYGVIADDIVIPHLPVNLLGGEHPSRVTAQQLKYFVFERCETNSFAVYRHAFALGVEHQSADDDLRFLYLHCAQLGVAPQLAFHARDQLGRVKRLCNVIIRTCGQSEDFVRVLALGRQQYDRQVFAFPYL